MRDRLLAAEKVKAIDWRDGTLYLLDQRALPSRESWVACSTADEVAAAIRLDGRAWCAGHWDQRGLWPGACRP